MRIQSLDPKKYKRFFAFGCSFTNYYWPTWADIIGQDSNFYENWAQPGAGNHFIFNSIIEADARYNFNSDDLIIIMWSTKEREDRYSNGKWIHDTSLTIEDRYGKEWVEKFHIDTRSQLIRDLAYIKSIKIILENKNVNWAYLCWNEYFNSSSLRSSFYSLLSEKKKKNILKMWVEKNKEVFENKPIPEIFNDKDVIELYQDVFTDISGVYTWFRHEYIKDRVAPNNDTHPTPNEALLFLNYIWPNNSISHNTKEYVKYWNEKIFHTIDNTKTLANPKRL
jgi:hypothetical protein